MPSVYKKSATGLRVDSASPSGREYPLPISNGGSRIKRLQVMVKQVQATNGTDKLAMKIEHRPDGNLWLVHTAYTTLGAATSNLWVLDSDASVTLSEFYRVTLKTDTSAGQSQLLDAFELGKPF